MKKTWKTINLDMPIQFKNSEIIKQKKKKRKQILGYFLLEI